MENIEQPQQVPQPQYIEQPVQQTKNPYKLVVIILSVLILILLVILVFLFSKVMKIDKGISLQQQDVNTVQNNSNETSDLDITNTPSVTAVQNKLFTLAEYEGVSKISFTYPQSWTLKQATTDQRKGWDAQLVSPTKQLTIWMGNASGYLGIAGNGCEKNLDGYDSAKINYYDVANIPGVNGYKLFTAISDDGKYRIYDSFVGGKSIDEYVLERNKDMRCALNGGGIKGKLVDSSNGTTSNLYIKIIIDELDGQSAESEQTSSKTTDYIKSIIESTEYQQAKAIILSAKMD